MITDPKRLREFVATMGRSLPKAMMNVFGSTAILCILCGTSFGESNDQVKPYLKRLESSNVADSTAAAKFLVDNWKNSLMPLIIELATFEKIAASPTQSDDDVKAMIAVTDVLRTILANKEKEGALNDFTDHDSAQVIVALAWMARGNVRALRINSTYILANVVDNTNVCIVLDHLRDPKIHVDGRINLLQAIQPVASSAYQDNAELIKNSLTVVERNAGNDTKVSALINEINQRTATSTNIKKPFISAGKSATCPKDRFPLQK